MASGNVSERGRDRRLERSIDEDRRVSRIINA